MRRASIADTEPVAIARIRRPVGLRGECIVSPFGRTLEEITVPQDILIGQEEGRGLQPIRLATRRHNPQGWRCSFEGREDRTSVEDLRGMLLYVQARQLPKQDNDEYYHFELLGLTVKSLEGDVVGEVIEVHNYPTTDALEVRRHEGSSVVIPMKGDFIRKIDIEKGHILVDAEGLDELLS